MKIGDRFIDSSEPPYIIAEVSCNHGGSLRSALELIDVAKVLGADAIKFQAVEPHLITLNCDRPEFTIKDGPWAGENLFKLYSRTQTPLAWFPEIKARAEKVGIQWFASVFDRTGVDLMVDLGAPAIKIASFEIIDLPLIRYAAGTGKPLIISTGMATGQEVQEAARACEPYEFHKHAMLHCVSEYPTPVSHADLLRLKFGLKHGFADGISDHSVGPVIPIAAVACGACIIEKHMRLSWHMDTEDSAFSLDEIEFAKMVGNVRAASAAMQTSKKRSDEEHRPLRRSLFAVQDIGAGEAFSDENVRSIRPGHGLPPDQIGNVLGMTAARDIARGEPMAWNMIGFDPEDGIKKADPEGPA